MRAWLQYFLAFHQLLVLWDSWIIGFLNSRCWRTVSSCSTTGLKEESQGFQWKGIYVRTNHCIPLVSVVLKYSERFFNQLVMSINWKPLGKGHWITFFSYDLYLDNIPCLYFHFLIAPLAWDDTRNFIQESLWSKLITRLLCYPQSINLAPQVLMIAVK